MQKARFVWFAIVQSTIIYFVVAFVIARHPSGDVSTAMKQPLVLGLYAAAVVLFFAAPLVAARIKSPMPAPLVVQLALYEACAVLSLVAALVHKDWRLYVPGFALALLGFLRIWPQDA